MSLIPDAFARPLIDAHNEFVERWEKTPYLQAMSRALGEEPPERIALKQDPPGADT